MTKTMEINELISELKEYDGELTVKVWSDGANKAYPISHVFIGSINKEDLVYINIGDRINEKAPVYINIGDRNLVDLSKIWHDASEMPKEEEFILVQFDGDCYDTLVLCDLTIDLFYARCKKYGDIRWAYVSDLLPKGGAK